jgi:NAD(P)-dependent dehydrogenase (short-subunit alcohol dehydrogenase family)
LCVSSAWLYLPPAQYVAALSWPVLTVVLRCAVFAALPPPHTRSERLQELRAVMAGPAVGAAPHAFLPVVCDVTKEAEVQQLPRIISQHWPGAGIDVLVNNAGACGRGRVSMQGGGGPPGGERQGWGLPHKLSSSSPPPAHNAAAQACRATARACLMVPLKTGLRWFPQTSWAPPWPRARPCRCVAGVLGF